MAGVLMVVKGMVVMHMVVAVVVVVVVNKEAMVAPWQGVWTMGALPFSWTWTNGSSLDKAQSTHHLNYPRRSLPAAAAAACQSSSSFLIVVRFVPCPKKEHKEQFIFIKVQPELSFPTRRKGIPSRFLPSFPPSSFVFSSYSLPLMGALNDCHLDSHLDDGVGFPNGEDEDLRKAVRVLLEGMGEDVDRDGLRRTPLRVSKAFLHGTRGYRQKVKDIVQGALFPEVGLRKEVGQAGGAGGLVVVRDLDLFSYCESCLLPFRLKCHIGYIPSGQRVLGLSKFSRVADVFAKRLQNPQRLADEIASALHNGINPTGVAVILQCAHIFIPNLETIFLDSENRGWVEVVTSAGSGIFEDKSSNVWGDFVSLLKCKGPNVNGSSVEDNIIECWCPLSSTAPSCIESLYPGLTAPVTSIIRSLGEDPMRKDLVGTPARFLKWLMNFQNTNRQINLGNFDLRPVDPSKPKREENGHRERVSSETNLPFCALCEHHLLPFHGVVHVGCIHAQGNNPLGRSLLQSVVHFYGFKLQVQERITRQIAETVSPLLGGDVMVVVEASHCCMISRGIEKIGSSTATVAVLGQFSSNAALREKFLQGINEEDKGS